MYITTPIYYANDVPHVGHAYTTIVADAVARYHRSRGEHVFLLTGTDEHGINIERIAACHGVTPQQHVDRIAGAFEALWSTLDISHDRFLRTSEADHTTTALHLWSRLQASGDVYRGAYEGTYCSRCEAYVDEDVCSIHNLPCEHLREENWFFRLSAYQQRLETLVRDTEFVQPESRRNEILGVLKAGLKDFSVSRRHVTWGIRVPETPDEVLYVWVDALASYLGGDTWPADTHLIGKEIIRFHCLYWPALLWSAGLELPRRVFAHGWLTKDGQKISKTTGNTIDPAALAERYGSDAVRYYFLRAVPFGSDGDFSERAFAALYAADLANGFGNLVQRVTTLAARHEVGSALESPLTEQARTLEARVGIAFKELAIHEAANAVGEFVREANRYLQQTKPWDEHDPDIRSRVLAHAVDAAKIAARFYEPFIPKAAAEARVRLAAARSGPPLFPRISQTTC